MGNPLKKLMKDWKVALESAERKVEELNKINSDLIKSDSAKGREITRITREKNGFLQQNIDLENKLDTVNRIISDFCEDCPFNEALEDCKECSLRKYKVENNL